MKIQPIQQNSYKSNAVRKNVAFSGAKLNAVLREVNGPSNLNEWTALFRKLMSTAKNEIGFCGDGYFDMINKNVYNQTAENICRTMSEACEKYFGVGKGGKHVIGKDNVGNSILLYRDNGFPAFLRFVSNARNADMGITTVGSKSYLFYRDGSCDIQYHPERFGGTMRKWSTPFSDEKFFNPDGSRDWGRGLRDLWESIKNG